MSDKVILPANNSVLQESLKNLNFPKEFKNLNPEEIATQLIINPEMCVGFFGSSNAVLFGNNIFDNCDMGATHAFLSMFVSLTKDKIALEKEVIKKEAEKNVLRDKKDAEIADYFENGFPDNFSN
jgi:hypothetical protein